MWLPSAYVLGLRSTRPLGQSWSAIRRLIPVTTAVSAYATAALPTTTSILWWSAPVDSSAVSVFPKAILPFQVRGYRSHRSRRGLYDGKDIRTGNNVSFSMRHTKRTFKPNVFIKRVYSDILDDMIQFHLTAATLRSIDKAGGLDNYLMKNEFTEGEGFKVKKKILKRLKNQAYLARKRPDANGSTAILLSRVDE
jgi:large subunit ribosomal protein L28